MMYPSRVKYRKLMPRPELSPYVEDIWYQSDPSDASLVDHPPTTVLPSARFALLFMFNDPFVQIEDGDPELLPSAFIVGQHTRPIHVAATGATGIVVVNFYPWGAAHFVEADLFSFRNASVDLASVYGVQETGNTQNKVDEAKAMADRVGAVEDFLLDNLNPDRTDLLVLKAADLIGASNGQVRISDLTNALGISRRQFIRRFKAFIGLSPKEFAGIVRFQAVFHQLEHRGGAALAASGYYDQPHFIKEFKRYTGRTPSQVLASGSSSELGDYFNNCSSPSHFYNTKYL